MSGFEPLPCASLLDCRPAPQPIEPLTSSKDWVSRKKSTTKKSGIRTPLLTQSFELVSGSIGWGAGLQSSRLAQGKGSNPLKVLIKENKKVIYQMYKSAKFGLVSYCHYISLIFIYIYIAKRFSNPRKESTPCDGDGKRK